MEVIFKYYEIVNNALDAKYVSESSAISSDCSICLMEIGKGQGTVLSCKHMFHLTCIEKWFFEHQTCCVCRSLVKDTVDTVYGQQIEKSKRNFFEKLLKFVSNNEEWVSIKTNTQRWDYEYTTLVLWGSIELIDFEAISLEKCWELDFKVLNKEVMDIFFQR